MQLLAEGEIWPGMAAEEFAARRKRLADGLPPGGVAIIPAASRTFMTGAIPYAYRQAGHLSLWHVVGARKGADRSARVCPRTDVASKLSYLHML